MALVGNGLGAIPLCQHANTFATFALRTIFLRALYFFSYLYYVLLSILSYFSNFHLKSAGEERYDVVAISRR